MEYGTIERELHIDASPEVVFEVISRPEHIQEWWSDEADFESVAGGSGRIAFRDQAGTKTVALTVVDTKPPTLFSFRWTHPDGEDAVAGNSLLVTFELVPSGEGTVVRMTETGFREMGWEIAVLEEVYNDHSQGWDYHLSHLGEYVTRLVSSR